MSSPSGRKSPGVPEDSLLTLVLPPTSLGPLVRSLPVLEALAAGGRSLLIVAPSAFHGLLAPLPGVRGLLEWGDSEQQMVEALRSAGCREAVVLEESLDAAWLVRRAGICRRWGYGGWLRRRLLSPGIARPTFSSAIAHRTGARTAGQPYYRRLLRALDAPRPEQWAPVLRLPEEARQQGAAYLRRAQLPEDVRVVGLVPGGTHSLSPRWPWQSFAALAQDLRKRIPNVRCALFATAAQLWFSVRVHEETARFVPVLGPDLDLVELAGTLSQTHLIVGNSGGLLDLASALGVPSLVLTSGRSATGPLPGQYVLEGRTPGPLLSRLFRRRPIFSLEVETVLDRCEELLDREENR